MILVITKADDSRTVNATLREDECSGTCILFETSSGEGTRMSKACVIQGDKNCEVDVIEDIATKKDIESEVAMNESMVDGHVKTFSTLVPETFGGYARVPT